MASHTVLLTFLVTTAIFAFMPGPAMLYAAARTLAGGRASGLLAALGIHLGGYVHVAAAAAGLSALFQLVPVLSTAMKLIGGAYLVWLGIGLFRSPDSRDAGLGGVAPTAGLRAFRGSVAVEVLNPKTAIFYLAFLSQFADPGATLPVWLQLTVLGTAVNAMFSAADLLAVLLADLVMARLRQTSMAQRAARRTGGTLLVGLGAHLALHRS